MVVNTERLKRAFRVVRLILRGSFRFAVDGGE